MSGPGEDDGPAIEMRPIAPAGRLLPADKAVLRDWVLRADPREGTLVLTEDRPFIVLPPRRRLAALPASGRKDAVVTVCLASYRWRRSGFFAAYQEGISWRLLLLDRDGRGGGRAYPGRAQGQADLAPRAVRPAGERRRRGHRGAVRERRGARPRPSGRKPALAARDRPGLTLISLGAMVILILIIGAAVYLTRH